MTDRTRPIEAKTNVVMDIDNPIINLGSVKCLLHTRHNDLKDDFHKKDGRSCIFFCRKKPERNTGKEVHNSFQRRSIVSRKPFKNYFYLRNCFSYEKERCVFVFVFQKKLLLSP